MEYGKVIWNNCHNRDSALLDNVQYEAARVVAGEPAVRGYMMNLLESLIVSGKNYMN